jgi:hypothetical protein
MMQHTNDLDNEYDHLMDELISDEVLRAVELAEQEAFGIS